MFVNHLHWKNRATLYFILSTVWSLSNSQTMWFYSTRKALKRLGGMAGRQIITVIAIVRWKYCHPLRVSSHISFITLRKLICCIHVLFTRRIGNSDVLKTAWESHMVGVRKIYLRCIARLMIKRKPTLYNFWFPILIANFSAIATQSSYAF